MPWMRELHGCLHFIVTGDLQGLYDLLLCIGGWL